MNPRLFEIALKRERLLERIGTQRERLASQTDGLRRVCAAGDRAVSTGRYLREHPKWLVAGAVVAVFVIRPRRLFRLARNGFFLWRAWTGIRRRLPGLMP